MRLVRDDSRPGGRPSSGSSAGSDPTTRAMSATAASSPTTSTPSAPPARAPTLIRAAAGDGRRPRAATSARRGQQSKRLRAAMHPTLEEPAPGAATGKSTRSNQRAIQGPFDRPGRPQRGDRRPPEGDSHPTERLPEHSAPVNMGGRTNVPECKWREGGKGDHGPYRSLGGRGTARGGLGGPRRWISLTPPTGRSGWSSCPSTRRPFQGSPRSSATQPRLMQSVHRSPDIPRT